MALNSHATGSEISEACWGKKWKVKEMPVSLSLGECMERFSSMEAVLIIWQIVDSSEADKGLKSFRNCFSPSYSKDIEIKSPTSSRLH